MKNEKFFLLCCIFVAFSSCGHGTELAENCSVTNGNNNVFDAFALANNSRTTSFWMDGQKESIDA
ncbi:hypothetical protein [Paraburkholderia kururiensis]|uniref:hypothetical protein n=1 Tax=Paraburkholderia kururiensis TaxID=984307 RepID=UPI00158FE77F|nr:hypothetical protein [Paraburkholderia kururiensis]